MNKLSKLMEKKKGSMGAPMSENEKTAKMGVLGHLKDMAASAMGDKIHNYGMKKVSVESPTGEGLKAGLEKAHDLVAATSEDGKGPDADTEENVFDHAASATDAEEAEPSHQRPMGEHPAPMMELAHDSDYPQGDTGEGPGEDERQPGGEGRGESHDMEDEASLNAKIAELHKKLEKHKAKKA
jgi:hypothetical protein